MFSSSNSVSVPQPVGRTEMRRRGKSTSRIGEMMCTWNHLGFPYTDPHNLWMKNLKLYYQKRVQEGTKYIIIKWLHQNSSMGMVI